MRRVNINIFTYLVIFSTMFITTGCENGDFEYWLTVCWYKLPWVKAKVDASNKEKEEVYNRYLAMCSDSTRYKAEKEQIARSFAMNIDSARNVMLEVMAENPDSSLRYARSKTYDPLNLYSRLALCDIDTVWNEIENIIIPDSASVFYDIRTKGIVMSRDEKFCIAFISIYPNEKCDFFYDKKNYFIPVLGYRKDRNDCFKIYSRSNQPYPPGWRKKDLTSWGIKDFVMYPEAYCPLPRDVFDVPDSSYKIPGITIWNNEVRIPTVCDSDYFDQPLFEKYNDSTYNFQWYKDFRPGPLGKYAEAEKDLEVRQFHYPY